MYTLTYDQRAKDTIGDLPELCRTAGQGATECNLFPTIGHCNPASGTGRAPQPESFRGSGSGHQGTFKKEKVDPCAVHTACYLESMSNAINTLLANLDSAIAVQERIIDTYEGMLSLCNNGDGADHLFAGLDKAQAEKARLEAEWNGLV